MHARHFLLPALLAASAAQADTLRLVSPDYWCPFSCAQDSPQQGFTVDIVRRIFEPQGYRLEYQNENYARALMNVRAGRADATTSTLKEEAPDFIFPKQPISRNRYCVYVRADSPWAYTKPSDFGQMRVGVIAGYDYGKAIGNWLAQPGHRAEMHSGDKVVPRLIDKVRRGWLDALIEDESLVAWLQAKDKEVPLRNAGCEAATYGYLGLSPAIPHAQAIADQFDQGMSKLRSSGELDKIMRRYGLRGW